MLYGANCMRKILVVDDEHIIRKRISMLLKVEGFDVSAAETGEQALEIISHEDKDIVVLDINLPGISGLDVLESIRMNQIETQVILATGQGDIATAVNGIKLGAYGYLQKPIDFDDLLLEINKALQHKDMQQKIRQTQNELDNAHQNLKHGYHIASEVCSNVNTIISQESSLSNIKRLLLPMEFVGGDLFFSSPGSNTKEYFLIGDFTGHGLSAAIGAIPVYDIFHALSEKGLAVPLFVEEINLKLKRFLPTGFFLCACLIEADHEANRLTIWNGGIPDSLIIGKNGTIKKRLKSKHLPLGIVDNNKLDTSVEFIEIEQGDRIILYTDGIIEAEDKAKNRYGQERFEANFAEHLHVDTAFERIQESLTQFIGDSTQNDDITLIDVLFDETQPQVLPVDTQKSHKISSHKMTLFKAFSIEYIRKKNIVSNLMDSIMALTHQLEDHKTNIFLILSELINNAVDYGVLKMDSAMKKDAAGFAAYVAQREERLDSIKEGWIKISIDLASLETGGTLTMQAEDSGIGFDYQEVLDRPPNDLALCGKGIKLIQSMCTVLNFIGNGNIVKVIYEWDNCVSKI